MMSSRFLLCIAILLGVCFADFNLQTAITQTPICAQSCTVDVLRQAHCDLTDMRNCLCYRTDRQTALASCVLANCTQEEQHIATVILQDGLCTNIDQGSRWPELSRAFILLATITYPIVILRFVSRAVVAKRIWWDDWCILLAVACLIPMTVLPFLHPNEGFGRHFWDIKPIRLSRLRKTYWATQMLYCTVLALSKISILLTYLRIFPDRRFHYVVIGCICFIALHGIAFNTSLILQCIPIRSIWTMEPAQCINLTLVAYAGAGANIFEDVVVVLLPVFELRKLAMSPRRKLAVAFMFALGSFATIASIIRLQYIAKFSNSVDVTWDNVDVLIWSDIEMHTSVVFPSLIAIRPLVVKLIPARFRSQQSSTARTMPRTKQPKAAQRWTKLFNLAPTDAEMEEKSKIRGDSQEGLVREMEIRFAKGRPDLMKELPRLEVVQDLERGTSPRAEMEPWTPTFGTQTTIRFGLT